MNQTEQSDSRSGDNSTYQPACHVAVEAARAAGQVLRAEFRRPGGPRGQSGKCPADADAEGVIRTILREAFPKWPLYGEELGAEGEADKAGGHLWLIDPNDGTSAFQKGWRGAAVSIALLRNGEPVLGVVYAPDPPVGREDLFVWAEGCGPLRRNGQAISRKWADTLTPQHTVLVSQNADRKAQTNHKLAGPARFCCVPSIAYRLALVASGEGEVGVSLASPVGYDYAAGHALLQGVGGVLLDGQGNPIVYSTEGNSHCGGSCFGGGPKTTRVIAERPWGKVFSGPSNGQVLCWPNPSLIGISLSDQLDRAQGCLFGQIAGDSLGSLVEFQSAASIRRSYPDGVCELADGGCWNTLAGQPTDDSELALELARSLAEHGEYADDAVARAYARWYQSHPFDCGGTIGQALSAVDMQSDAGAADRARAAANTTSQANGALMRVSPLGIFGWDAAPDVLAGWATKDASLTHPHPLCLAANEVFVIAIAAAIRECGTNQDVFDAAWEWANYAGYNEVVQWLVAARTEPPPKCDGEKIGWVKKAFQNTFHWLLHASSFEEGVVETVMLGGDTDTNAAIAGALLGAVHGAGAVPMAWRDRVLSCRPLEGRPGVKQPRPMRYWPVDALILAERLFMTSRPMRCPLPSKHDG